MSILSLTSVPASQSDGFISMRIALDGSGKQLPRRAVEVRNLAEAQAALQDYIKVCTESGLPMVILDSFRKGQRAPRGYKDWRQTMPDYISVNLQQRN